MTTLKVTASSMAESLLIRCNLTEAASPVQVDYLSGDGEGWQPTQYQCANVQHREQGLVDLGAELLAKACECSVRDLGEIAYEVI